MIPTLVMLTALSLSAEPQMPLSLRVEPARMPDEFLGNPKFLGDMRIGDEFWVPAHALEVDIDRRCWLNPKQTLDATSLHLILVTKKLYKLKDGKAIIGYHVHLSKQKLQGHRWKVGEHDPGRCSIPVHSLEVDFL
jgi:hypothetical protein